MNKKIVIIHEDEFIKTCDECSFRECCEIQDPEKCGIDIEDYFK